MVADGVLRVHAQHLPVHLSLVNQSDGAEHLDLVNVAHRVRNVAEVHDVEWIIVAKEGANVREFLLVRVLPRLGNGSVVDHAGGAVEAQLSVLEVLHDGVHGALRVDFRLGTLSMAWIEPKSVPSGNLHNAVHCSHLTLHKRGVAVRNILRNQQKCHRAHMPRGDGLKLVVHHRFDLALVLLVLAESASDGTSLHIISGNSTNIGREGAEEEGEYAAPKTL